MYESGGLACFFISLALKGLRENRALFWVHKHVDGSHFYFTLSAAGTSGPGFNPRRKTMNNEFSDLARQLKNLRKEVQSVVVEEKTATVYAFGGRRTRYPFAQATGAISKEGLRVIFALAPRWTDGGLRREDVRLPVVDFGEVPVVLQVDKTPAGLVLSLAQIGNDGTVGLRVCRSSEPLAIHPRSRSTALEILSKFCGAELRGGRYFTSPEVKELSIATVLRLASEPVVPAKTIPTSGDVAGLREQPGSLQRHMLEVMEAVAASAGIDLPTVPRDKLAPDESVSGPVIDASYL